ncbi:MAG: metallophosphoesterase family protein [Anaerolineales bacterium]|jgi:predicted phosphodiesterase
MRVAIFGDIHGNTIALNAVLADIDAKGGVDDYWILGDLVAIGYDPVGVLERLSLLPSAKFVRGNTDRYILTGELPPPTLEEVQSNPGRLPIFIHMAQSFAWTAGAVTASKWDDWLRALPLEHRTRLPDGTNYLGVHASPGNDDGTGFYPGMGDEQLQSVLAECDAELVCVGHTHTVLDIEVGGIRVINPGSVSNPFPPDLRASYAILQADDSGYSIEFMKVEYDRDAVIEAVQRANHPAKEYIIRFMRGENRRGKNPNQHKPGFLPNLRLICRCLRF